MHSAAASLRLKSGVLSLGPLATTDRTSSDYPMHAGTHIASSVGLLQFCCREHMLYPHFVTIWHNNMLEILML